MSTTCSKPSGNIIGFAILSTIIYYTVYRKRLPCIGDEHEKLDALKEKEKEMIKNEKMPELQFGDVIKWGDDSYCIVGANRVYYLRSMDKLIVPIERSMRKLDVQDSPLVEIVYRRGTCGFDQEALGWIYNGTHLNHLEGYIVWKRPKVREMTVEQIEKELGYKIKVVGSDR